MRKIAVIIYGPPGSGKSTQARFLSAKLDLFLFDTGRYLDALVHDPKNQNATIKRERKLYDAGKLMTPSFVLRVVRERVERIARANSSIVFSGSPRTLYEAEGLLPVLAKEFGKKNVYVFVLDVPISVSVKRNGSRYICKSCAAPLLAEYYPSKKPKHCPVCAGPLYKRTDDNPKKLVTRLNQYDTRTKPIFALMKKEGYRVHHVNGKPAPFKLFRTIYGHIKK
ncbi:MAG: nucleoside monophosphate kinase [Patescibacteria group bacterium]